MPAVVGGWVGGWLAGCVSVRVQERVAERACLLVGYNELILVLLSFCQSNLFK